MGDERRGGGRWECRGWEVGERGEGDGREECGRKKYFLCKTNLEPILYHFKVISDLTLVFHFLNFTV